MRLRKWHTFLIRKGSNHRADWENNNSHYYYYKKFITVIIIFLNYYLTSPMFLSQFNSGLQITEVIIFINTVVLHLCDKQSGNVPPSSS